MNLFGLPARAKIVAWTHIAVQIYTDILIRSGGGGTNHIIYLDHQADLAKYNYYCRTFFLAHISEIFTYVEREYSRWMDNLLLDIFIILLLCLSWSTGNEETKIDRTKFNKSHICHLCTVAKKLEEGVSGCKMPRNFIILKECVFLIKKQTTVHFLRSVLKWFDAKSS